VSFTATLGNVEPMSDRDRRLQVICPSSTSLLTIPAEQQRHTVTILYYAMSPYAYCWGAWGCCSTPKLLEKSVK